MSHRDWKRARLDADLSIRYLGSCSGKKKWCHRSCNTYMVFNKHFINLVYFENTDGWEDGASSYFY